MKTGGVILIGAAIAALYFNRKPIGSFVHRLSEKGLALLQSREGVRLTVYRDAAGKPTIGYGHLVRPGEDWTQGISAQKAVELLRADTAKAQQAVARMVTVPVSQNQYDALVSLVFNIGAGAFAGSTLLKLLNQGFYAAAGEQFLAWRYAGGKPVLLSRRIKEKAQFEAPDAA